MDNILFIWYDSHRPNEKFYPYFTNYIEILGKKDYYTRELLKLPLSNSKLEKIKSAKEGTSIKISYLHSVGNLCVRRLRNDEIEKIKKIENLSQELEIVNSKIKGLIPEELQKKKTELETQIRKLKKQE